MKKIFLTIFILIFLNSCGFQTIYSSKNLKQFSIKIINIEGETDINNFIKGNLKPYENDLYEKKFNLIIKTDYEKKILTKNKQGKPTDYELAVKANFEINSDTNNYNVETIKKINIKSMEDLFQERKYEKSIKQNLVNIITDELINKISVME